MCGNRERAIYACNFKPTEEEKAAKRKSRLKNFQAASGEMRRSRVLLVEDELGAAKMLARARALLRRVPALLPEVITVADLSINTRAQQVTRAGPPVELTTKEYALLEYLARHADEVVSRADIADGIICSSINVIWERACPGREITKRDGRGGSLL